MTERVEGIKTFVACGDDRTKNTIISTKKTAPEDDPSSIVDVDSIEAIKTRAHGLRNGLSTERDRDHS